MKLLYASQERDVLWYSVVHMFGPCRQDREKTVSFRIIQLGTLDCHDKKEKPNAYQVNVKVIG
jgi:hypothetical protein